MTAYEIQKGISKNPNSTSNLIARELLGLSRIEAIGERVADRAANIHADLKSSGITIGTADEFIAAQALEVDATLVTNNTKHFERVPGLKLESWL
jgi:tRNA(fMet)-specific endonuclease VapC